MIRFLGIEVSLALWRYFVFASFDRQTALSHSQTLVSPTNRRHLVIKFKEKSI
ncbi:MAG: hypothetical protein IJ211_03850 [Campylobacter sp.]|nr:hypothetical protein [Campylobacter sp.]